MQNLGQICRFLWAKLWTYGQNRGQNLVSFLEVSFIFIFIFIFIFFDNFHKITQTVDS